MRRLLILTSLLLFASVLASPNLRRARAAPATPTAGALTGDFNGDGFADLAVGVAGESIGSAKSGGGVNVIYGSPSGLTSSGNQFWSQNSPAVKGIAEKNDEFGFAEAVGDFNGDGFSDLAIGVPGESIGSATGAGAVNVLYGSASGLTSAGNQLWTQNLPGVPGSVGGGHAFGRALAAGDFNGDGKSDLAIGEPGMNVNSHAGAGGAVILYGSASGLTSSGSSLFNQDSRGIHGVAADGDAAGRSLIAGDFGGGPEQDLAIGNPFDDVSGVADAGSVNVLYGSGSGLSSAGNQLWTQNSPGIRSVAEPQDLFGFDLVAGTFAGGAHDDLAIGVPNESTSGKASGAVNIVYSNGSALSATGNQFITEDSLGGTGRNGDGFGNALASGDFGAGGAEADLAVAAAGAKVGSVSGAGSVMVINGSPTGLASSGTTWSLDTAGIAGTARTNDFFGADIWAADFDGSGQADLVAGATFKDLGSAADAGTASVIYGSVTGLTTAGNQIWSQNTPGIIGTSEAGDEFSFSLI